MPATLTPHVRNSRRRPNLTACRPNELAAFLPAASDPDYLWVLSELICDDLKQNWDSGQPRHLNEYRDSFPELFRNTSVLQNVADQEYQLRKAAGENPDPKEYCDRYGVKPPNAIDVSVQTPQPVRKIEPTVVQSVIPVRNLECRTQAPSHTREIERVPASYDEYEQISAEQFPKVGETVEGFLLKELLGRGAFAQVYLAEQVGLSNRLVAVKLTRRLGKEAGRLARLQHANIVPIFSFHASKEWQAICMPYFGRQTLDDIIRTVRAARFIPKSGCEIFSTIAGKVESTVRSTQPGITGTKEEPVRPSEAASRGELREMLTNLSYPDATVLLAAQIVDGLVHAHSLGIWHLDLKPANVLISDHGQPMLLDFNLAFDTQREDRQRFGGTVAYMSPEQLDEMIESRKRHHAGLPPVEPRVSRVDPRTDLFALGVILYELLTGRHPFPTSKSNEEDPFEAARFARFTKRPTARQLNPSISSGINAIIERLLSNRISDRYPSAVALRHDLIGHLEHKPLVHVREKNLTERFTKWRLRHPKAITKLIAAAAIATAVSATGWGLRQWQHTLAVTSRDQVAEFRSNLATLRIDLTAPDDSASIGRGLNRAKEQFRAFGLDEKADLRLNPILSRLAPNEQDAALADFGEIATLAVFADAATRKGEEPRDIPWQAIAENCFKGQPLPRVLGGDDSSPRSDFLTGALAIREGRTADAIGQFERVVNSEPQHAAAHFLYAIALTDQFQLSRASERFEMAAALAESDPRPPFNRGLILSADQKYQTAEASFTEAIRRDSSWGEAYFHRASARRHLAKYQEALADCETVIKMGEPSLRIYVLQSRIHLALGDLEAEAKAKKTALATKPVAEADYLARGLLRNDAKDYSGALEDFRTASSMNSRYFHAWNNQAYILGEKLGETDLAIAAMDKAVEANSQSGELRLGRAVLNARIGKRDAAHADAEKGLLLTTNPKQTYQAACVYALTSKTNPDDAKKAVELLRQAVRDGFRNAKLMQSDTDLTLIRDREDVVKIIEAVKTMVN